jgi:hypothetical protein
MCTIEDYKNTCGDRTWEAMVKFATSLKTRGTQIAFFSSTPQGGGVALMRHALVRFAKVMGVNLTWYVVNLSNYLISKLYAKVCAKAKTRGVPNYEECPQHPTRRCKAR